MFHPSLLLVLDKTAQKALWYRFAAFILLFYQTPHKDTRRKTYDLFEILRNMGKSRLLIRPCKDISLAAL